MRQRYMKGVSRIKCMNAFIIYSQNDNMGSVKALEIHSYIL